MTAEPVFVRKPGATAEDQGWNSCPMCTTHNATSARWSSLTPRTSPVAAFNGRLRAFLRTARVAGRLIERRFVNRTWTTRTIGADEHRDRRPNASSSRRSTPRDRRQRPASQGLPSDLVRQATPRLRVMALLYAAVFFLAGFFPSLHLRAPIAPCLFGAVVAWLPADHLNRRRAFRRRGRRPIPACRLGPLPRSPLSLKLRAATASPPRSCSSRKASTSGTPPGSGSRGSRSGRSSSPSSFPRRRAGRCSRRSPRPAASP